MKRLNQIRLQEEALKRRVVVDTSLDDIPTVATTSESKRDDNGETPNWRVEEARSETKKQNDRDSDDVEGLGGQWKADLNISEDQVPKALSTILKSPKATKKQKSLLLRVCHMQGCGCAHKNYCMIITVLPDIV